MEPDASYDVYDDGSLMADPSASDAASKKNASRKRTKTGCLTCRKRRIKCGEERPVCKNCIKSKRHCDGYSQRVVFKPPTFDYQPIANGAAHITFQSGPVAAHHEVHDPGVDQPLYSHLRPRPVDQAQFVTVFHTQSQQYVQIPVPRQDIQPSSQPPEQHQARHVQHLTTPITPGHVIQDPFRNADATYGLNAHTSAQSPMHHGLSASLDPAIQSSQHNLRATDHSGHTPSTNGHFSPAVTVSGELIANMYGQMPNVGAYQQQQQHQQQQVYSPNGPVSSHPWMTTPTSVLPESRMASEILPRTTTTLQTLALPQSPITSPSIEPWPPQAHAYQSELSNSVGHQPDMHELESLYTQQAYGATHRMDTPPKRDAVTPEFYDQIEHAPAYETPTYILTAAAVETQDDDYYDVDIEEEEDVDTSPSQDRSHKRQRTLAKILSENQVSIRALQMRRYDTFLYAGILDRYRVENVANPLKNSATFHVFAHFISATGPSLSIFERHPRSSSVLFNEGGSVPPSQQGLWTYTMPNAALRHQGLLHAMLALASLHIARLQGASVTPSMQHYAWALKRIHKSVSDSQNRMKLTNIAATMLLGFYEILTADHMKWNMHLAGARQLFVETDFVSIVKGFERLKLEKAASYPPQQTGSKRRYNSESPTSPSDLLDQIPHIDERVVSEMVGTEVRYNGFGYIDEPVASIPPEMDIGKFEILKDLYWWYCKQDAYQSIVSGNPLLMDFIRWANCPPRSPLGKVDAVYGSFDHLMLLLGRIADFSSRDRARKLKQVELNGGFWRPAPGMDIPRPPSAQQPHQSTPSSGTSNFPGSFVGAGGAPLNMPPPMPEFYGMAPPPRTSVQMPSPYAAHQRQQSTVPQSSHIADSFAGDLQAATASAIEEHKRIMHALQVFKCSLGPSFEPLTSDFQHPMETSFGPAIFYRSYDIGCLWAIYNMSVIIALRAHPHMPPAAHMAAGVAAKQTASYANDIGRIVAGIVPGPPEQQLNPSVGAALGESCMPSFFAAVQYQDPRQRHETVVRLFSIAKRTGWGSAELIANGCETSWVKAAAAGRGPPYERIVRAHGTSSEDPRLNGSWENLDPNAQPDEKDDTDRRLVRTKANARLNWAIGVMGVEEDVTDTGM